MATDTATEWINGVEYLSAACDRCGRRLEPIQKVLRLDERDISEWAELNKQYEGFCVMLSLPMICLFVFVLILYGYRLATHWDILLAILNGLIFWILVKTIPDALNRRKQRLQQTILDRYNYKIEISDGKYVFLPKR